MKKSKLLVITGIALLSGVVIVVSCKKDEDKVVSKADAVGITAQDANSTTIYDDIYTATEEAVSNLENNNYPASTTKKSASGRTITVTKNAGNVITFPKEITITYDNWTDNSGRKKNGTIKITQSAKMRDSLAIRTVTFDNFVINDSILVDGTKTIVYKGRISGKPTVNVKLNNGKITFTKSGLFITKSFDRTWTWEEGYNTPFNIWDDVYSVSGSSNGSSKKGYSYSTTTIEPLKYKVGEFCIKTGKLQIKVEASTILIDYTRTLCTSKVKITVDGGSAEDMSLL